ncbi:MAG: thiamine pyrophosphate-binding protein [Verrucomicrobia bacterium]|nr:thiamine pyrophosphate-binding protein [Verrucomicrobiota bacterium]
MIRLADYVIAFLENAGIEDIFTVSGGGSIFLCDAVARAKRMRYYCCHHEQAVSMAAEGYARVKGSLGAALVTVGPGATNAITGVACCWIDSVPQIVLSGQSYLSQTVGNSGLRQVGVQELNIIDLIRPITKYAVLVTDPSTIKYHLQKAIHLATTGRPGPVWLDIPANVQNAQVDETKLAAFDLHEQPAQFETDLKSSVAQIIERLRKSKRPLIHAGQGIKIAGGANEFMTFVEKNQLPFVTAWNANDIVNSDYDLFVGRPGVFGQHGANFAVQNADFYLAVGTRLSLPVTGYNSKDFARNAFRVMVDIDKLELDKQTLSLHMKVHADAKAFLTELNRQLAPNCVRIPEWLAQCQAWKAKYPVVLPEYRNVKGSINAYYFVDLLSDLLDAGDIVVTDMGASFQCTHQAFRVKQGQRVMTNSGFAPMGWGLPAAVGACLANQKKRTICIAGEGGLLMNLQELATVMHHQLPIKLFIYNNGGYLTIKHTQKLGFEGRLMGCNGETGLSFPDMLKIGEAHGIPSVRLTSQDNLKDRVSAFLDSPGMGICELMLNHDQELAPKLINRRMADGTTKSTPYEDLYPFLDREEIQANMIAECDQTQVNDAKSEASAYYNR